MDVSVPTKQPDIDELARDKVDEIEGALGSSRSLPLDTINSWLSILKQIITAADLHRTNDKSDHQDGLKKSPGETEDSIYADYADDNEQFDAVDLTEQFASHSVKWTIRVRAFKLVHRLVRSPISSKFSHLRLLPDLVRLSFVAATSPYDDLKLQGFEMFKFLIEKFGPIEEKEFPGHSILEQYRSQYVSAIKPAFGSDSPPYITAIASQVCSLWICNGLEKRAEDLRRTFQLMELTIDKLKNQSLNQNSKLYTESELEQERLDILGSWAQLYVVSKDRNLSSMIEPHVEYLYHGWWEALKDYALLIMPATINISTSHDSQHVYTREVALRLFNPIWCRLVLALSMIITSDDPSKLNRYTETCDNKDAVEKKYFKFLFGIIMKELIGQCTSCEPESNPRPLNETTIQAIHSLELLTGNQKFMDILEEDPFIAQELHSVLYLILMRRSKAESLDHKIIRLLTGETFKAIASKIVDRPLDIKHGIALCVAGLRERLDSLETKTNSDLDRSQNKLDTRVLIRYLVAILKSNHKHVDDESLQRDLVATLCRMIKIQPDLDLGIELLALINDGGCDFIEKLAGGFLSEIFDAQLSIISTLILSINRDVTSITNWPIILNKHYNYINMVISRTDCEFMRIFLESTLKSVDVLATGMEDGSKDTANQLMTLVLGELNQVEKKLPNQFKDAFSPEMKATLEYAKNQQHKLQQQKLHKSVQFNNRTQVGQKSKGKAAAKIILKSDFSNYLT